MNPKPTYFLLLLLSILLIGKTALAQTDTSFRPKADSLSLNKIDSIAKSQADSLKTNSLNLPKSDLEGEVVYNSFDSIYFDILKDEVHLYNKASVTYLDYDIKANYIIINYENQTISAKGLPDSTGKMQGLPVFKDGNESYKATEMIYNFKTQKAKIIDAVTEQQGGFLVADEAKIVSKKIIFTKNNIFTTCDQTHDPHFGVRITKGKFVPEEKIIAGPSYLEVAHIPLPIGLPFAYYPMKQGQRAGIIFPDFGESELGFFARGLGFFTPIGEKYTYEIRGDIYSLGSWRLNNTFRYKKRYKYNGNISVDYSNTRSGNTDAIGYQPVRDFFIRWDHRQDAKARPNSQFSANVNAGTSGFLRNNSFSTNTFTRNSLNSSISYSKTFAGTPFSFAASLRHNQNTSTKQIDLDLPELSVNMRRINPLKRKKRTGPEKWYEKIGFSYTSKFRNHINSFDSLLFEGNIFDKITSGVLHNIPISTSFKLFKYVQVSPSLTYNERWYFRTIDKNWLASENRIQTDTTDGFFRTGDFSTSLSFNTRLFGNYLTKKATAKVVGVRHIINPSMSFSYRPDYARPELGYFRIVQSDSTGNNFQNYTIFDANDRSIGLPPQGRSGSIGLSIDNKIEMKVRQKDSANVFKKIQILDGFRMSGSYNLAADSLNFSNISFSGRTTFKKFSFQFGGVFDPYVLNEKGQRINTFEINENKRLMRLNTANLTITGSLRQIKNQRNNSAGTDEELDYINRNPFAFIDFSVPFNLSFNYTLRFTKATLPEQENIISQNITFNGDLNITPKWKVTFSSGYDITMKEITPTQIGIYRDLHCWDLSFNWVPFGTRESYLFTIRPKSALLQALKLTQRKDYYDFGRF